MKQNNLMMTVVIVLAVGVVAVLGGMKYQQAKTPQFRANQWQRGMMGRNGGFRPVSGEIMSVDDKSMTVKLDDGSSKIVILADSSKITKSAEVAKTELKAGVKVAMVGTVNSDGSVTAQNIELNPALPRGAIQQK